MQLKPWITAARLRTLPLTVSNILLGSLIAYSQGKFNLVITLLGLATAILLQVLSNYANDYGDFVNGADEKRISKYERALQSGKINPGQMRRVLIFLSALTFIAGISLIASAARALGTAALVIFIITGILCIIAAITYTIGKKPYGYIGMGDIAVFIFFGIVGVCGIYVLQTQQWNWFVLLPASSFGLLSVGVLNINNIRDIESDRISGKKTLVVRIGLEKAKAYHAWLIIIAVLLGLVSTLLDYNSVFQLLYLVTIPFFIMGVYKVRTLPCSEMLDDELRNLSLTTFLYSVTYGVGLIL
ncbi:MAG: 1,4-dihydroxy-2-naphthoate octaprenyltransferase [Bacteroidales bacterium]